MTTVTKWVCLNCKNYVLQNKCLAFPEGIPEQIYYGTNKHLKPLKGQKNNIIFESKSK